MDRYDGRFSRVLIDVFFFLLCLLMIYPFWYVLMYSLSDPTHVSLTSYYLKPVGFSFDSYLNVFSQKLVFYGFKNSVTITLVGTLISLFLTITLAYPLSRDELRGKKLFSSLVMFTMIFNGGMIPTYIVVRSYKLVDTLWALMLPNAISVYNTLIMIKFFKNIPVSLIESAKIDGYNDLKILVYIILPLSTSVIATIALFYGVSLWNAFLPGMIYINTPEKWPLQVVMRDLLNQTSAVETTLNISTETVNMATVAVTVAPIMMIYPFLQKYFVKGIMLGAVKG